MITLTVAEVLFTFIGLMIFSIKVIEGVQGVLNASKRALRRIINSALKISLIVVAGVVAVATIADYLIYNPVDFLPGLAVLVAIGLAVFNGK